jgi:hypothetical protein
MKGKRFTVLGIALAGCLATNSYADLLVKSKYTSSGQTTETTIYTKGARQRFEPGAGMAIINQCDLKRTVQLIDANKSYLVMPMTSQAPTGSPAASTPAKSGVVNYNINIVDTGERKQMFGFTARRVRTTTIKQPGAGACSPAETVETDGWYIDYEEGVAACAPASPQIEAPAPTESSQCQDEIKYTQTGDGKLGYPLAYTLKSSGTGGAGTTMEMEVAAFSPAPLDAALFEVPAGYTELNGFAALGSALPGSPASATAASPSQPVAAKAAGTVRVGIVEIANRSGKALESNSLRAQLIGELADSKIEAIPLGASGGNVEDAARALQCDFIAYLDVTEIKKASGGLGKLGGMLNKASSLAGGAPAKEKVEAKVDYRLSPVGGVKALVSSSAKGSNGGGFTLKSAVSLAARAGSFAMFMQMGMFNPSMMQALGGANSMGMGMNMGMAGIGRGGLDPGLGPFMSIMQATQTAMAPAEPSEETKAVGDALNDAAKNLRQALTKK